MLKLSRTFTICSCTSVGGNRDGDGECYSGIGDDSDGDGDGDGDGVLTSSDGGPIIWPSDIMPITFTDHRFNRKGHPWAKNANCFVLGILDRLIGVVMAMLIATEIGMVMANGLTCGTLGAQ